MTICNGLFETTWFFLHNIILDTEMGTPREFES